MKRMEMCDHDHCLTCSDEMIVVRVLQIDETGGSAHVEVQGKREGVDITLVDGVVAGDTLLVHAGVAIEVLRSSSKG